MPSLLIPAKKLVVLMVVVLLSAQTIWNQSRSIEAVSNPPEDPIPLDDDFRLCRINPEPVLGQPNVEMPGLELPMSFQCTGDLYDQFATLMEQVIQKRAVNGSQWGKRKTILPASRASLSRYVLIMGNSHTRQLASTLLCQYKDHILNTTTLYTVPGFAANGILQFQMKHNLTIYVTTNCPFVYSPNWDQILNSILPQPLSQMDVIITGEFNSFSDSRGTNHYKMMMAYQKEHPNSTIDFETIPPPTVKDLADKYSGPIIHVSMFAKGSAGKSNRMMKQVQNETNRTNVRYVKGRKYIYAMQELMQAQQQKTQNSFLQRLLFRSSPPPPIFECSSDQRTQVGTCNTNVNSPRFSNGHRCIGSRGGHPDLIAWDVIHTLYKLLLS
ncbi:expressed unknown protein [Seminavis robusta]|uniref:Uncharacterized protein n=1 Tax=Seminavis robusta TaxID=568900 RepID=A0A9N8HAF8_9STRA|nr:expressed unknown protein [Seminavis robusta]|eukprot:Sro223_g091310.1 n/a (384) ;mRNA; r:16914-18065